MTNTVFEANKQATQAIALIHEEAKKLAKEYNMEANVYAIEIAMLRGASVNYQFMSEMNRKLALEKIGKG
jgi:hypothetical protein